VPVAMVNYLALLGWSIGASGDEVMTLDALIKRFSLKKVNASPAAFDYDKLEYINSQHLKRMEPARKLELTLALLRERDWRYDPAWQVPDSDDTEAYAGRLIALLGGRFSSLLTLPEQLGFFFVEDFAVDETAWREQVETATGRDRLQALSAALESALPPGEPARAQAYETAVRELAEAQQLKAGELIHPARVALTGQGRSAGIFEVMEAIGRPRVLERLRRAAG